MPGFQHSTQLAMVVVRWVSQWIRLFKHVLELVNINMRYRERLVMSSLSFSLLLNLLALQLACSSWRYLPCGLVM